MLCVSLLHLSLFVLFLKKLKKSQKRQSVKFKDLQYVSEYITNLKELAEVGFDPTTFGLWAQRAPTAPLCFFTLL